VLTNNDGSFTVQVDNPVANATYYLRVSSDGGATGQYEVATDFRMQGVLMDMAASGTLSATTTESAPAHVTCQDQLFHFALTAGTTATPGETVTMNIYDADHQLVFSLSASAGDTVSDDVFLAAGVYSITYSVAAPSGSVVSPIVYSLSIAGLTDPVVSSSNTTTATSGGSTTSSGSDSTTTSSSGSPYTYSSAPPPSDCSWY
jgi:7-keto-8-aminopelargonate synthetase-like enzyme